MKGIVQTDDAPAAVGAYSQATTTDDLVFTAGQLPMTPDGELLDEEPIDVQTEQALANVAAILEDAGSSIENALKVTVYMADIEQFEMMNETYSEYFETDPPARSAIEVSEVPKGAGLEIEAIGLID